jgi:chemotaxis protein MotB
VSKLSSNRPIIIKKKKGGHHGGHHGGAWKVAYADFVTAMMAFFLVMWILGLSESTRKAIAGYFNQPGVFSFTTGKALPNPIEVMNNPDGGDSGRRKDRKQEATQMINLALDGKCPTQQAPAAGETQRMTELEGDVEAALAELARSRPDLAELVGSITVEITPEGLRIELSEVQDKAFFDVKTAKPNRAAREVLAALGPKLAKLGNEIDIEGHTDARLFPRGATYTN